jgi:hypothetical protein
VARSYYANVPISEPTPQGFTLDHDFGGIGWDQKKGFFIPVQDGEINLFMPPEPKPSAQADNSSLQNPNALQQLMMTQSSNGNLLNQTSATGTSS